jgi:hypothetical protein
MDKLSVRLTAADTANVVTIAEAMRSDRRPFVTRSAVLKLALKVVAEDPKTFVGKADRGPMRGQRVTPAVSGTPV